MQMNNLMQITEILGLEPIALPFKGVAVDSRLVEKGNLFVALPGAKVDGHAYLQQAAQNGAVAAIVNKNFKGNPFGLPVLPVSDTLQALQLLTTELLKKRKSKIVGITGSVGKTTTKDFINTILKEKFKVAATPGNSNSQIGIPLAILNHTQGDEEVLVVEMGMTHAGDLARLIEIAPPDIAVLTAVALVHACNFNSLEEIAQAKSEIFLSPKTEIGIISRDVINYDEISQRGSCRKVSFSVASSCADYRLRLISNQIQISTQTEDVKIGALNMPGNHNRHNLLAAVTCARCLGVSWAEIERGVQKLELPERRLQMVEKRGILFVNDSYNASAVSVKAALESMPVPQNNGKRIAVIGEMAELGSFSESCHLEVAEAALNTVESMFCLGDACKPIFERWTQAKRPVELFQKREDLVASLRKTVQEGDVVLLKGSRANNLWKVLEEI